MLEAIGIVRIAVWQNLGFYDYGEHWVLIALTLGAALVGIVTFGSLTGSMLPFIMQRIGFDPASASAPFVSRPSGPLLTRSGHEGHPILTRSATLGRGIHTEDVS
jgi:hypothetical protein